MPMSPRKCICTIRVERMKQTLERHVQVPNMIPWRTGKTAM
jgi:hypothetical protein